MDNELKQALSHIETIIGSNYKNLKDDVNDLKANITKLSDKWEFLSKSLGENESNINHLEKDFESHKKDDKEYGMAQAKRIDKIENFQFKMILTILGSSTISGTIASLMVYLLK